MPRDLSAAEHAELARRYAELAAHHAAGVDGGTTEAVAPANASSDPLTPRQALILTLSDRMGLDDQKREQLAERERRAAAASSRWWRRDP